MSPDFSRSASEGTLPFHRCHTSCWPGSLEESLHGIVPTEFIVSSSMHAAAYREWVDVTSPKLLRPAQGDSPLSSCGTPVAGRSFTGVDVQPDLLTGQGGHDVQAAIGTPRSSGKNQLCPEAAGCSSSQHDLPQPGAACAATTHSIQKPQLQQPDQPRSGSSFATEGSTESRFGRVSCRWSARHRIASPAKLPSDTSPSSSSSGSKLGITGFTKDALQDLMRSRDRLREASERPFRTRGLPLTGSLDFADFREALYTFLLDLGMKIPVEEYMILLFDKHRGSNDGIGVEALEALLFRFLCFLRASGELQPAIEKPSDGTPVQGRERRWREEFIQTNQRNFDDFYVKGRRLGRGSFGAVYLVEHKAQLAHDRQARVCKVIPKAAAASRQSSRLREEFVVLKQLDHPHVLRIFEYFEDADSYYLLMEQCCGGDLYNYIQELDPMDAKTYEFLTAKVMQHTLSALAYCHSKAIIHKDLKPENIMLSTPKGTPLQDVHVVVVDFGLSEMFAHSTDRSGVVAGTPAFMAPEVWRGNFSKSCDVWSAGCVLFFLLSGKLPFFARTLAEFPELIMADPDWGSMGGASAEAQRLCRQLLNKAEHLRPTAPAALGSSWFTLMGLVTGGDFRTLDQGHMSNFMKMGRRSQFEKFVSRFVATQMDASQQHHANQAFRMLDVDGNGVLSVEELRQGLASLGAAAELVDEMLRELDVGETGQISYTEFLAAAMNLRNREPDEQDRLLWSIWEQFRPDSQGMVAAGAIQDAFARLGMAVADLPQDFLVRLTQDASALFSFEAFKQLLLTTDDGFSITRRGASAHERLAGRLLRWLAGRVQCGALQATDSPRVSESDSGQSPTANQQ